MWSREGVGAQTDPTASFATPNGDKCRYGFNNWPIGKTNGLIGDTAS